MAEVSREQVKDYIKNMSLMDAATLVKELETELGVSARLPVMAAMPGAAAGGGGRARGGEGRVHGRPEARRATRRSRSSRSCASSPVSV